MALAIVFILITWKNTDAIFVIFVCLHSSTRFLFVLLGDSQLNLFDF